MNTLLCPACGRTEHNVKFVCSRCWWKVPPKDRVALFDMDARGQDTKTKVEKIIRNLKALP